MYSTRRPVDRPRSCLAATAGEGAPPSPAGIMPAMAPARRHTCKVRTRCLHHVGYVQVAARSTITMYMYSRSHGHAPLRATHGWPMAPVPAPVPVPVPACAPAWRRGHATQTQGFWEARALPEPRRRDKCMHSPSPNTLSPSAPRGYTLPVVAEPFARPRYAAA